MVKNINEMNVQIMDINEMKAQNGGTSWNEIGYGVASVTTIVGGLAATIAVASAAPVVLVGGIVVLAGGIILGGVSVGATIVKGLK